ncbi:MAG: hypothetical protein IT462_04640 [Planctomycetes bacterium]|nr:hypothetical protein [Planctomycetota bacterium]
MDTHIDQSKQDPSAFQSHLQVELRLFARLEAAAVLLRGLTELGSEYVNHVRAEQAEARAHSDVAGPSPAQHEEPTRNVLVQNAPATNDTPPREKNRVAKHVPRLNAAPIAILAFRAATLLVEVAPMLTEIAHRLIANGVDVEREVYRRRLQDYINEELARLGVNLRDLSAADGDALNRALLRIDDIVNAAIKYMRDFPGRSEHTRRRTIEKAQPQGP